MNRDRINEMCEPELKKALLEEPLVIELLPTVNECIKDLRMLDHYAGMQSVAFMMIARSNRLAWEIYKNRQVFGFEGLEFEGYSRDFPISKNEKMAFRQVLISRAEDAVEALIDMALASDKLLQSYLDRK